MKIRFAARALLLATVCMAMAGVSTHAISAEDFSLNWLSYGLTDHAEPNAITGLGTTNSRAQHFLYEHYGTNEWGSLYFGLLSVNGKGVGSVEPYYAGKRFEMYAFAVPALSLAKLTGKSFTFGPISDVQLISSLQQNSAFHYQAAEFGVNLTISAPHFQIFDTGLLTHDTWIDLSPFGGADHQRRDKNQWMWRTYAVSKPIDIGSQRFSFVLQSYINTTGSGGANKNGTQVLLITDYMWNIRGNSDYQVGLRHWYTRNKNTPSQNAPMLFFKYYL